MSYWLVKSEPFVYSFEKLQKEGKGEWDGVRNYQARNNLRAMKCGDLAFFYHSNEGLEIVGIVEISKEAYPDPTFDGDRWSAIEVVPYKALKKTISLEEIKRTPGLENMVLVKNTRLSVQPVTNAEWNIIIEMSETEI